MNKEFAGHIASNKQIYRRYKNRKQQPLAEKVVQGGIWIFGFRTISKILGFIRTIVLARLLSPIDFGLFGISLLALSILETFSQTGVQPALIRKKDNIQSYMDTAWTISVIRGVILFLILIISAPVFAKFFNSPQATTIIRVIAISTLISGFKNIGLIFFEKELEFKKLFVFEISGALTDVTVALVLAFYLKSVWALVWAGLAANFVRLFMSFFIQSYRPQFSFNKEKFKDLFAFGRWVLGSSILIFLVNQGDDIFVGKMIGVSALGFYQMAYLISNLPATEITNVISQIAFPTYSIIQNDLQKLKKAYLEIFKTTMFISCPIAGGILVLGSDFTVLFLGDKWMPMVTSMQVLSLWGLIRSSGGLSAPLFQALNRPDIPTKLLLLKVSLLILLIYPLTIKFGILGTAVAVLINALLINPVAHYISINMIKGRSRDLLKGALSPCVSAIIMIFIIEIVKIRFELGKDIYSFLILVFLGIAIYLFCNFLLNKQFVLSEILFSAKRKEKFERN